MLTEEIDAASGGGATNSGKYVLMRTSCLKHINQMEIVLSKPRSKAYILDLIKQFQNAYAPCVALCVVMRDSAFKAGLVPYATSPQAVRA